MRLISTIDILKALVDEVNIHGCLPENRCLNIPTAKYVFEILEFYEISEFEKHKDVKAFFEKHLPKDKAISVSEWLRKPQKGNPKKNNEALLDEEFDYVSINTINSQSPVLWRDASTSRGTILTEPNPDGFFMKSGYYGDSSHLCYLLRRKDAPSLYRGML